MKTLIAALVVVAFARFYFGLVMFILNTPFALVLVQWEDRAPDVMERLRHRIRSTVFFFAAFIGVLVTVITSFYIFHVLAHAPVGIVFPMTAVTIPILFSIRADIRDWKLQYANVWNKEFDVSEEFRRHADNTVITVHRTGFFAKTCALVVAWLYFCIIGDPMFLHRIGM